MNKSITGFIFVMVLMSNFMFNFCVANSDASQSNQAVEAIDIEAFVRSNCPHCAAAEEFLNILQQEQPNLRIVIRDATQDSAALERLKSLAQSQKIGAIRVPAIQINGQLIVGYSDETTTGKLIRDILASLQKSPIQNEAGSCEIETALSCEAPQENIPEAFELNFFGQKLTLTEIGLPLFTVTMGLLDGFNPCSMWVLILMIS
ncbi:MAG: glutaredoxin domain-containing protein, partial [Methylococcaceae bacterium]